MPGFDPLVGHVNLVGCFEAKRVMVISNCTVNADVGLH